MSLPDTNGLETLCEQAQSLLGGVYSLYAHGNPSWTEERKALLFFFLLILPGVFEPASRMFIQHLPVHSYDLEELWTYHVTLAMGVQHDDVRTVCDFITERCLSFDCVFDSLLLLYGAMNMCCENTKHFKIVKHFISYSNVVTLLFSFENGCKNI